MIHVAIDRLINLFHGQLQDSDTKSEMDNGSALNDVMRIDKADLTLFSWIGLA